MQKPKSDHIMAYIKSFNGFSLYLRKIQILLRFINDLHGLAPASIFIFIMHQSSPWSHFSHLNFLPILLFLTTGSLTIVFFLHGTFPSSTSLYITLQPGSLSHPQTPDLGSLLKSLPCTSPSPLIHTNTGLNKLPLLCGP